MDQALNYFDHFKEGMFMYRKDGRYPIDNNLEERQVRPFIALRKAIQHYGRDAGAEMAAVYLSVVSTVKIAGQSVWRFLGGLLRGYGDRMEEASFASKPVDHIKAKEILWGNCILAMKNGQKIRPKRPEIQI